MSLGGSGVSIGGVGSLRAVVVFRYLSLGNYFGRFLGCCLNTGYRQDYTPEN